MTNLVDGILQDAQMLREKLQPQWWLVFCEYAQFEGHYLKRVIDERRNINPATQIRLAAVLELVGVKTRLSTLSPDVKLVVMDLGQTKQGDFSDYFEAGWDRAYVSKYVTIGEPLTRQTLQRVSALAAGIRKGVRPHQKPKTSFPQLSHLKHEVQQVMEIVGSKTAPPEVVSARVVDADLQRSAVDPQRTVESLVSMLNSIAAMASANIDPQQVSDQAKLNLAMAAARVLERCGVTNAVLVEFQRRGTIGRDSGFISTVLGALKKS